MFDRPAPIMEPVWYLDPDGEWHYIEKGFWPMPQDIEIRKLDTSPPEPVPSRP